MLSLLSFPALSCFFSSVPIPNTESGLVITVTFSSFFFFLFRSGEGEDEELDEASFSLDFFFLFFSSGFAVDFIV
jgi:hypothetical protein